MSHATGPSRQVSEAIAGISATALYGLTSIRGLLARRPLIRHGQRREYASAAPRCQHPLRSGCHTVPHTAVYGRVASPPVPLHLPPGRVKVKRIAVAGTWPRWASLARGIGPPRAVPKSIDVITDALVGEANSTYFSSSARVPQRSPPRASSLSLSSGLARVVPTVRQPDTPSCSARLVLSRARWGR